MMKFDTLSIEEATERIIDYRGKTPPKTDSGIELVTAKVIKGGRILRDTQEFIAADYYDEWMRRGLPQQYDVLITTEAPLGEVAILRTKDRIALAQRVILLRARSGRVDPFFLFYALQSDPLQGGLRARGTGTTVLGIKQSELRQVKIPVFSLPTQHKIAAILSAYDDLIENNLRRIKILEEIARNLYREWFVNFRFPGHQKVRMVNSPLGKIPEGWKVGTLSEVFMLSREGTSAGDHLSDRKYVPVECLPRKSLALLEAFPWEEAQSSLQLFEEGDILFGAMRPYFHKVVIAPFKGVTRTTCFVLRPRRKFDLSFGLLALFQDETIKYATTHSQGATIPYAVWNGSLADMRIAIPESDLLERFHIAVSPILRCFQTAFPRSSNLRKTRDLLLPKLISGGLDVSKLNIKLRERSA
jgi:type I restriction enzyme S subunit